MDDNSHNDYFDSEHLRNEESIDLTEKGQTSNLHMNHNYSCTVSTRENDDKHDIHDNKSPNINKIAMIAACLLLIVFGIVYLGNFFLSN